MAHSRSHTALSLLLLATAATAQLQELTLKDAMLKAGTDLGPERLPQLSWVEGAATYSFVKGDTLWENGIGKMTDGVAASLADLNRDLPDSAKLKAFPAITWESAARFRFQHNAHVYTWDRGRRVLHARVRLLPGAANEDMGEGGRVAYTVDNDLYIGLPNEPQAVRVTNDGTDGIVNGQSVHRNEYGIEKGTFWSPDGSKLAFYRMDERMVTTYQLEDIGSKPSSFRTIRYPMAGQASHHVRIGVFDLATRRTLFLNTGLPEDQYLTNIAWGPDARHLYVVHLDRATTLARLVEYDLTTGNAVRTVLEERDERYVEPQVPMHFLKQRPQQFIWTSARDGWTHLYLYDLRTGLVRQLTTGAWNVKRIVGLDARGTAVFVEGTEAGTGFPGAGAIRTQLLRVELSNGRSTPLTSTPGTHHGDLSSDGQYLLDRWSSTTVPARIELLDARTGQGLKVLLNSRDPLAGVKHGPVELLTIPGQDGDRLHARLIKPSGFDSRQRYPVIVYLYNGPHVQLVTDSWLGGAPLWMLHAAERGYLVFSVDGRGSEGRGRAFEQAVHRRLGEVEMQDQLHGVAWLKGLPYVDPERMAVHGWSFGGFMTTSLMLKAPGAFKLGVAGGPVMDWTMYEVMYTERYMDTPQENPDGYAASQLVGKCDQLQGELLIIHGQQDDVVLPEHSYAFLKDCIGKGEQVEFFVYPGHAHNVRGRDRLHLMTMVLDRIDRSLRPGT